MLKAGHRAETRNKYEDATSFGLLTCTKSLSRKTNKNLKLVRYKKKNAMQTIKREPRTWNTNSP